MENYIHKANRDSMENYIHKANLTLFKKRLGESHTEAQHHTIVKLLADEEAKDPAARKGTVKR